MRARTAVMSIAGFDPSAGAGILADIKTFEQLKVYGFGVLTANTWQNDEEVKKVEWIGLDNILEQIDMLLEKTKVDWFKIGIVKDEAMLKGIVSHIRSKNEKAAFVWDPVLKASSGYTFFSGEPAWPLLEVITPNKAEFEQLFGTAEKALDSSAKATVYLKGGHNEIVPGKDELFHKGKRYAINPKEKNAIAKHGSGCIFSSALCAHLAMGYPMLKACVRSKAYTERVLASNETLLGWHKR